MTRNSDLFVEEEEVKDLRKALQGELPQRHLGDAVRLEVDDTMIRRRCPRSCWSSSGSRPWTSTA